MSGEHILVDGYSILHAWDEFKKNRVRNFASAREALILLLTRFHDSRGGRLTVVFDGRSIPQSGESIKTDLQILYSRHGETADAVIERMVGQSPRPQNYLVATNDYAEQTTVEALGARVLSAEGFHAMVKADLADLEAALKEIHSRNRS